MEIWAAPKTAIVMPVDSSHPIVLGHADQSNFARAFPARIGSYGLKR
ncbi:MAG: hypothetical protein IPG54_09265 [Sphingomonadales bacterium]|jgi:hypothetical protein|nr:hypothetical protein [Sphingomonadales bacterium]MBK9005026.1 hypothetical protein [Sphingomonadales bacterium]MBK9267241.1 hypothetical protein [Sphingomonadales bacterium]MBP6433569.1 hypothetical protein [Sphingorhabdus sp.]